MKEELIKKQDAIDAIMAIPDSNWTSEHYANAIKAVEPTQQWIPVSERLPEEEVAVMAYCPKYKNVWAVSLHHDGHWYLWHPFRNDRYDESSYGELIAWMPLPEPWKKVKA